jgi:magnesium transporter
LLKLAGVSDASQTDSVFRSVRARAPWILVNIGTALAASTIISAFATSIEQIVALAVLMPVVASMGGNVGNQTLAVAVRALASRELTDANAWRYLVREAATGASQGLMFGLVLALVAYLWFQHRVDDPGGLAIAVGAAVVINLAIGGIVGIAVPLFLRRVGADPAVSSSVFVTFTTDALGFLAFLGLATLILLS